jgi:hypothetical protein
MLGRLGSSYLHTIYLLMYVILGSNLVCIGLSRPLGPFIRDSVLFSVTLVWLRLLRWLRCGFVGFGQKLSRQLYVQKNDIL